MSQGQDPQSETGCSVRDRITSQGQDHKSGTGSQIRDWITNQGLDPQSRTGPQLWRFQLIPGLIPPSVTSPGCCHCPAPPGQAPRPCWGARGARQPCRAVSCSLMWHTARFCSSQEQDTRMYFSQFPAPPWPASPQNFSVPRASGICGRTGQERGQLGPDGSHGGEKGRKRVCRAELQT